MKSADTAHSDTHQSTGRSWSNWLAFIFGIPLGFAIVAGIQSQAVPDSLPQRFTSHPVEVATVVLTCCALIALLVRLFGCFREHAALQAELLPSWDGDKVAPAAAGKLLREVDETPGRLQKTYLFQRIRGLLEFVDSRRSVEHFDDQLRTLADNDEIGRDSSYGLIRLITWAIPILGFLGTVLGITEAVSNVSPEVLEHNLSSVTEGLGVAFDTTALALLLTMVVMGCSYVVESMETGQLAQVNRYVDVQLAHRFAPDEHGGDQLARMLHKNTERLLDSTGKLVEQQVNLWNRAFNESQKPWQQASKQLQDQLIHGVEEAMQRTLVSYGEKLRQQEEHFLAAHASIIDRMKSLAGTINGSVNEHNTQFSKILEGLRAQTEALTRLAEGGSQIAQLNGVLQQNLQALTTAGTFEQAVNSLTAAIHLFTTKASGNGAPPVMSRPIRPGVAA